MTEYEGQHAVYEIDRVLDRGGMGEVYEGHLQADLSRRVAIKVPHPWLDQGAKELFLREAEAATRVAGPFVVPVVDWGQNPDFIAFEFIDGPTLAQVLQIWRQEGQPRSDRTLIPLFRQLVNALRAINTEVIHRDLKPANVFLDGDHLRVSDFGISKYVGEMTRTHSFKGAGSPPYMAPETFRGDTVTDKADQYSLGVMFYEMATGDRPFAGPEYEQQHLYEQAPRVSTQNGDISERLASVIGRMLLKRPEQRWPNWDALERELSELEAGLPSSDSSSALNPLVARAAEHIESRRQQELEAQRVADTARMRQREREQLTAYWADELYGEVERRVRELNRELGGEEIGFERKVQRGNERWCWVRFMRSELHFKLQPIPQEDTDEFLVWGEVKLVTIRRGSAVNLLLRATPPPYGSWLDVNMRVSGLVQNWTGIDRRGGTYDVFGDERLVLAKDWAGIRVQRDLRNTMSHVNYSEEPGRFESMLNTLMNGLVEDAGPEPPTVEHNRHG